MELFENALESGGIRKRRLCVLMWTETIFKTELFDNEDDSIVMWFPCPGFLKDKSKMTGDCCVFKFLWHNMDGKHLMHFRSKNAVYKFLRRSVGGSLISMVWNVYYFINDLIMYCDGDASHQEWRWLDTREQQIANFKEVEIQDFYVVYENWRLNKFELVLCSILRCKTIYLLF